MTEFAFVKPHSTAGTLKLSDVERVAGALVRGALAVLPTETGYMLAAVATSERALAHAFAVKNRPASNVMHVACASLAMADTVGVLTATALRLLGEFTPGPLTVIVEKTPLLPDRLVTVNGTVGIRIPDNVATLQVIAAAGVPLTATSLNTAGEPPIPLTYQALRTLKWPDGELVHVVEDERAAIYGSASTLVRLTGAEIEFLRDGPIGRQQILEAAR